MRKWEKAYEYYKSSEAKTKYNELKEKVDNKKAKQEELKEYNKMTKIFENLPKVENIKEYMEKLDKNLEILKKEYNLREDEEKSNNQIKKLENESSKLDIAIQKQQEECEKIRADQKQIQYNINTLVESNVDGKNDAQINDLRVQKKKLESNYEKNLLSIQDKEDKIRDNKAKKEDIREDWKTKVGSPELVKYNKKQLRKECFETAGMINKCNVVARHLMEGFSRESIEMKLAKDWKDRKFTSKDPLPLTRKEREAKKERETIKKETGEKSDLGIKETFTRQDYAKVEDTKKMELPKENVLNKNDKGELNDPLDFGNGKVEEEKVEDLAEIDQFEKAFPRLAKILPKFIKNSRFAQAIASRENGSNKIKDDEELEKDDKQEIKTEPEVNAKPDVEEEIDLTKIEKGLVEEVDNLTDREKFVRSLRTADILDVADRGINTIENERKNEKLAKAKQDAIDRQNAKFAAQGDENYSKRSGDER